VETIDQELNTPHTQAPRDVDFVERRASPRRTLVTGVGFASDSNFYMGFSEDISEGGLFVATVMLQPLGARIELTFTLPNDEEVTVTGVVRWVRDPRNDSQDCAPGMGIQFESLPANALESIREFVDLREPIFFDD
jgi:uncharacterized protein (TIGR02266 family)